jgi:hypothetical protein
MATRNVLWSFPSPYGCFIRYLSQQLITRTAITWCRLRTRQRSHTRVLTHTTEDVGIRVA